MRNRIIGLLSVAAVFGCAGLAQQQVFPSWSTSGSGDTMTVTFRGPARFLGPPVTGAAYSADQVSEHTQTLADGTHITQNNTQQRLFRDSQGRTRSERSLMMGPMVQNGSRPKVIEIADPVAGVAYLLDEQNKIAHRVVMEARQPVRSPTVSSATGTSGTISGGGGGVGVGSGGGLGSGQQAVRPEGSSEKLGTQTIEGVIAEGTRHKTTWPIGSQGNDRPMTDTSESWYSQELKLMVLSKSTSARNGESITRLTNVSRAEPDPALFQPPPDFTVVDDKDSVTMTLKRQ